METSALDYAGAVFMQLRQRVSYGHAHALPGLATRSMFARSSDMAARR